MKDTEIEIQVQIARPEALQRFLQQSATYHGAVQQVDEYFTPPDRDFLAVRPVAEWLRLRRTDDHYSVTYKRIHYEADGTSHRRDEYETGVGDGDAMRQLWQALGYHSLVTVRKYRTIYRAGDFEIVFDIVDNLGSFVEVEYVGEETPANPRETTAAMLLFLQKAGAEVLRRSYQGYPFLLLFPDEATYEIIDKG